MDGCVEAFTVRVDLLRPAIDHLLDVIDQARRDRCAHRVAPVMRHQQLLQPTDCAAVLCAVTCERDQSVVIFPGSEREHRAGVRKRCWASLQCSATAGVARLARSLSALVAHFGSFKSARERPAGTAPGGLMMGASAAPATAGRRRQRIFLWRPRWRY